MTMMMMMTHSQIEHFDTDW